VDCCFEIRAGSEARFPLRVKIYEGCLFCPSRALKKQRNMIKKNLKEQI
jgi:hypothetical protein